MYRLYYHPLNASMTPRFVLEALGVDHELVFVDRKTNSQRSPDYLKLNPTGRIPVLVAGDIVVFESAAICLYLCDYFLFMLCVWADELSSPPLGFKNLNKYLKTMAARPEIERVCRHENLDLEPYV